MEDFISGLAAIINGSQPAYFATETFSCLSNDVHKLIDLSAESDDATNMLLDKNGLLDWNLLPVPNDISDCVIYLKQLAKRVSRYNIVIDLLNYKVQSLPYGPALLHSLSDMLDSNPHTVNNRFVATSLWLVAIERYLYDIYAIGKSTVEEDLHVRGKSPYATIQLKDVLNSPLISSILNPKIVRILKALFLAKGINIRNLIWHGFMAPSELCCGWAKLLVLLAISMPSFHANENVISNEYAEAANSSAKIRTNIYMSSVYLDEKYNKSNSNWSLFSFDKGFQTLDEYDLMFKDEEQKKLRKIIAFAQTKGCSQEIFKVLSGTLVIPPGRDKLVLECLLYMEKKLDVLFSIAALPLLEHGLRCIYAACNEDPFHIFAHQDQYYSTLDGYGQRSKHILLLSPFITKDSSKINKVPEVLGRGLHNVLTDLFLQDDGPGLRGKICHGDIDLSYAYVREVQSESIYILFICFVALCWKYKPKSELQGDFDVRPALFFVEECNLFCNDYKAHFHPHSQLKVSFSNCNISFGNLYSFMKERYMRVECGAAVSCNIANKKENRGRKHVTICYKSSRLYPNTYLFDVKEVDFSSLYVKVEKVVRQRIDFIDDKYQTKNFTLFNWNNVIMFLSNKEDWFGYDDIISNVTNCENMEYHPVRDLVEGEKSLKQKKDYNLFRDAVSDAEYLAWEIPITTDNVPLPSASCVNKIASICHDSLISLYATLLNLENLVLKRKATSAQRKAFVLTFYFSPLVIECLALAMKICEIYISESSNIISTSGKNNNPQDNSIEGELDMSVHEVQQRKSVKPNKKAFMQKLHCAVSSFSTCLLPTKEGKKRSFQQAFEEFYQFLSVTGKTFFSDI